MINNIVLASASPRRYELLSQLGVNFKQVVADIDESVLSGELPQDYVQRLALAKATVVSKRLGTDVPVLGADTIVVAQQEILGKPTDFTDFKRMMQLVSGQCHQVFTAVALVNPAKAVVQLVGTEVWFRTLTEAEITAYWQTGEPQDKAGGYGIQGKAARFIQRINGSYGAVVGLPLCETEQLLQQFQEELT